MENEMALTSHQKEPRCRFGPINRIAIAGGAYIQTLKHSPYWTKVQYPDPIKFCYENHRAMRSCGCWNRRYRLTNLSSFLSAVGLRSGGAPIFASSG